MPPSPTRVGSAVVRVSLVVLAVACSAAASRAPTTRATPATTVSDAPGVSLPAGRGPRDASARTVRILLSERQREARVSSSGRWRILAADGRTVVALTEPGERWVVQRDRGSLSAQREDSRPVSARESSLIVRPLDADGTIETGGRRWRGELVITPTSDGVTVINRLPMDDYLKGVVPLEIGTGSLADAAAVEAQAVTARSYAVTHLAPGRPYDMRATVQDQVYGGAGAETAVSSRAVERTSGLVLLFGGRVVNAPYHATCGGSTAEPQDAWRTGPEAYLTRVSDQIPGTSRFYCDAAPRYRWTRTFSRDELRQSVDRYARTLARGSAFGGAVRAVRVASVTPAGRVGVLTVDTDRGPLTLRGNEIRDALRLPSGEILYSTYFSVEAESGRGGVESLTLRGGGNGHGVGMCQAGAIGRARAGQDFRTILRTYYSGTTVGFIE